MIQALKAAVSHVTQLLRPDVHPMERALAPAGVWGGRSVQLYLANTRLLAGSDWAGAVRARHENRQLLVGLAQDLDRKGWTEYTDIRRQFRVLSERSATLPTSDFSHQVHLLRGVLFAAPPTPQAVDALRTALQRHSQDEQVLAAATQNCIDAARNLDVSLANLDPEDIGLALQLAEQTVQASRYASRASARAAA